MADPGHAESPLRRCLLARGALSLPVASTFEPLDPVATNVPLSAAASAFATHTAYEVPCVPIIGCTDEPLVDVVHRFTLQRRVGCPLNERLTRWALHKERLAKECEDRLVHPPAGPGSDAGVRKTNVGGYQSYPDLFEDDVAIRSCLTLRGVPALCP